MGELRYLTPCQTDLPGQVHFDDFRAQVEGLAPKKSGLSSPEANISGLFLKSSSLARRIVQLELELASLQQELSRLTANSEKRAMLATRDPNRKFRRGAKLSLVSNS